MKKISLCIMLVFISMFAFGCSNQPTKDDNIVNMQRKERENDAVIVWEDRVYVSVCVVNNTDRTRQIGIVDDDEMDQIFTYKDYSAEEYIISYYHSGEMDNSMLYREENVEKLPEGIE